MSLIQSYDISQDILEKTFHLNGICLPSQVGFPFAIQRGLLFVVSTADV